jgi:two-component system alkaline phosphatase synthesis response regulator PhoP
VLIVDDEPSIRLLCRVNLELEGMVVSEAATGDEALELARAQPPDAMVLDVAIPPPDGWEVAARLLSDPATASIAIVFLSAYAEAASRARAIELGGVDYITKPFDPEELTEVLERSLVRAR